MGLAQGTSLAQSILRGMPPGIFPPFLVKYDASSVSILQLSVGSDTLTEQQLFDYGQNFVRTQLATVQGASVPLPYGGKLRQRLCRKVYELYHILKCGSVKNTTHCR